MAKPKTLPTIEFLKGCFCEEDGYLYWRERPLNHFKSEYSWRNFNSQFKGKKCPKTLVRGSRYLTVRVSGVGTISTATWEHTQQ